MPAPSDKRGHGHDRVQRRPFQVKPGREQGFLEAHAKVERNWPGPHHADIIQTGEGTFCIIGVWDDMDTRPPPARPHMIATLEELK